MLYFPTADAARLVQVRGLEGDYPYYGKVETTPTDAWIRLPSEPGILLEPGLLDQFKAKVGDKVKLGSLELPILGVVNKPAPRSSRFSGFAPEAYVRLTALARTGLHGTTSLAFHHLHLELPPGANERETKRALPDFAEQRGARRPEDRRETRRRAR